MKKLGRNYELTIGLQGGSSITLTLPFTIEFDITRNTLTSANVCQLRIYNLAVETRNKIRFNASDYGTLREVSLSAGYGKNLSEIFSGNISQAWSVREGTNFITQIECYDGGFAFANGQVNVEFPAGTPQSTVITSLASSLPGVDLGAIGSYLGSLSRGNSYSGNATDLLNELTGGGFFIDNGKVNCLGTNEYILNAQGLPVINFASGLLGTPVLEQTIVRFDMIFEPKLVVGQSIILQSVTESNFNGQYKVTAVKHKGMISESVAGTAVTTGEFFFSKLLVGVTQP